MQLKLIQKSFLKKKPSLDGLEKLIATCLLGFQKVIHPYLHLLYLKRYS